MAAGLTLAAAWRRPLAQVRVAVARTEKLAAWIGDGRLVGGSCLSSPATTI